MLPEGFVYIRDVIPTAYEDIRYAGSHNFVGCPVDGYLAPRGVLRTEAAMALKTAADAFQKQGLFLLIYDAYRPQRAVDHFVLFPRGYIAVYSGHSRGMTVDLTLTDRDGTPLDMGGEFDWFAKISSHDYEDLTPAQKANRRLLRETMLAAGFEDYSEEWWHYTLPSDAPKVYYDFPIE